ncbi:lipopolysaccharide biosynthesis protein [Bacillus toyonensis]|uniref:Polysaccharide biosynthesis protein C-terminal domain-containing protein n=1 Tax=Bacillus toyonensis TaxID=155322 RepID=A0AB73R2Z8_9BACI|nr:oligosaccharide flippase family protein [Bacillus toyonensis]PEI87192.1 hypothetical protein CN678_09100 [Bacillus toyonensis]PEK43689.1 hypothetical protein CN586_19035 [Bacillus toyonensis]PGD55233.1 hypothetical protein COM38_08150 [Bacillus toyonensis]PGE36213.1 hypothetical protein COM60_23215 [Bacillus toyonensis]PHE89176.1 hypothetical protein COF80_03790 [Bacillus toyonensis]
MNMDNKKVASNGLIYVVFAILTQVINMLLIPLYTKNLAQAEYGKYELLNTIQQLLSLAITLEVYSGMKRFFNDVKNKYHLKNTALNFSLLWGGIFFIIVYFVSPFVSKYVFNGDPQIALYLRMMVISSILTCLISIYSSFYAMEFKAFKSAIIQLVILVLTLLFASYFVGIIREGILGILKAVLLSNLIVFIVLFILNLKQYRPKIQKHYLKKMLHYGGGMLLGQVSAWILNLVDRFFIKGMVGYSAVAMYSIAYKIGMLINPVFITPFAQIFTSFKFKVYKETNGKEKIQKMFHWYNIIGCFCIFGLAIFGKIAISILATDEYLSAYKIIPLITISYFVWGVGQFYSLGLHIANKMLLNSVIVVITAIINIVLNILLVPKLGINGAALATIIAYLIANIFYYYFSEKYYSLGLGLWYPYRYFIIFLLLYGVYITLISPIGNLYAEFCLDILLCLVYVVLLILFRFITIKEIKRLFDSISNIRKK